MTSSRRIRIESDMDIVVARQAGRDLAGEVGFSGSDRAIIATAISELARNILDYAGRGEMQIGVVSNGTTSGVLVVARDWGPGIADVELAMRDGYSSGCGLGLGLPGTKRLMDEFSLDTEPGRGTTVTAKKWVHSGVRELSSLGASG